jgi:hypothetical protein
MTDEQIQEAINLVNSLDGRGRAEQAEISALFNFNNLIFPDLKEHGKSCDSCVARVYQRMVNWRNSKIQNKD